MGTKQHASAPALRAFLEAQAHISKRTASGSGSTLDTVHVKSKHNDMQLTISSLQQQLHVQMQQHVEIESNYHDIIEGLKLDLATRTREVQEAMLREQRLEQQLLQLEHESERAAAAEYERLDAVRQQLMEQQELLNQQQTELQAQRSAMQMQQSMADIAMSSAAQQQAALLVGQTQLNADTNVENFRWQQRQASARELSDCSDDDTKLAWICVDAVTESRILRTHSDCLTAGASSRGVAAGPGRVSCQGETYCLSTIAGG
jgi:hypothetical protein